MSLLFINEEDDMTPEPYKPSTSTIREEEEEVQVKQEFPDEKMVDPDEDDPIVESIPLLINTVPERAKQSLHVLQYAGRPKSRPNRAGNCHASIKPESQYLQVKVPLDTEKFFNVDKIQEWGEQIVEQTILGVLDGSYEVGNYAAKIINDSDGRRVVLIPVDSTVQLKPSFKYIDDLEAQSIQQRRQQESTNEKPANVQILQSAAKHSTQSGEFLHSLGDSLKLVKHFEEEEWQNLIWKRGDDDVTKSIKIGLDHHTDTNIELKTNTSYDEYIDMLINN